MNKIIFLDIDGVLNTPRSIKLTPKIVEGVPYWYGRHLHALDSECIRRLNKITDETDAKIVISSTWRHMFEQAPEVLIDHFKSEGIIGEIIGFTPVLRGKFRGDEIQSWFDHQGEQIDGFVILDDDSDMLHLKSHLVQTCTSRGIEDWDVSAAIAILEGE